MLLAFVTVFGMSLGLFDTADNSLMVYILFHPLVKTNPPNIIGLHLRSCQVEAVHPERARFRWRRLRPWQRTCAGGHFLISLVLLKHFFNVDMKARFVK